MGIREIDDRYPEFASTKGKTGKKDFQDKTKDIELISKFIKKVKKQLKEYHLLC